MEVHVEPNEMEVNKGCDHKTIVIFHITGMQTDYDAYTNSLAIKMEKFAKENNLDISVRQDSASKIDSRGKEADIILLTPELFEMEEVVKAKFPDKIVNVIGQKDYGFLNAENIMRAILS